MNNLSTKLGYKNTHYLYITAYVKAYSLITKIFAKQENAFTLALPLIML